MIGFGLAVNEILRDTVIAAGSIVSGKQTVHS